MIATVEATTTASKNYAVGDLLVYDGKLYKVTSAIATGATIIAGSNVTQTTVGDQLGSGGGSGGYELVADVTVESDVTNLNPLSVYLSRPARQLFIYAQIQATTGSTSLVISYRNALDEGVFNQTWPGAISTTKKTLLLEESIFSDGNILTSYNLDNSSSQTRRSINPANNVTDISISALSVRPYTSEAALTSGSEIKVYAM